MLVLLLLHVHVLHDGNNANILLRDFDACGLSLFEADLEHHILKLFMITILLDVHVVFINFSTGFTIDLLDHLVINQIDRNLSFILIVVKFYLLVLGEIVFKLRSTIRCNACSTSFGKLLSFDHAGDFTVRAFTSNDLNVHFILEL